MKKSPRILILFDVDSPTTIDQDFSEELKTPDWATEYDIIRALEHLEYPHDILGLYDDTNLLIQKVEQFKPDIVFNLVERFRGNTSLDRDVVSFLELLGIPYTGCGPTGLTLCKNKGLSKQILSYHRIHTPKFIMLTKGKPIHRPKRLEFPILIKPLREEASYGISQASFVENDEQFKERVEFVHSTMGQDVIAEEYIDGREFYVSLLGNKRLRVFPIRELKFTQVPEDEPKFATFRAKWDLDYRKKWGIRNQFTGNLPAGWKENIEKVSKKIYRLLAIRGYARMDLRVKENGSVYFIEANPNPMLAEWEDFAESALKEDFSYKGLIDRIITLGFSRE